MMEKFRMRRGGVGTADRLSVLCVVYGWRGCLPGAYGLAASDFQVQLAGKVVLLPLQDQIDPLANVFRDRDLGLFVKKLEELVLLGCDVHGGGDFLPCHDETMHDHMFLVNETCRFRALGLR